MEYQIFQFKTFIPWRQIHPKEIIILQGLLEAFIRIEKYQFLLRPPDFFRRVITFAVFTHKSWSLNMIQSKRNCRIILENQDVLILSTIKCNFTPKLSLRPYYLLRKNPEILNHIFSDHDSYYYQNLQNFGRKVIVRLFR